MVKHSKLVYVIGSVIIGIVSVLGIIAGLIFGGVIDGSSRKLVFASGSAERTYDGTTLACDTWELKSGELKNGHTAYAVISGSQVGAGTSANDFVVYVLDTNGADVSGDYEISYLPGTLTVNKRKIELVAKSGTHTYDGTAYSLEEYELSSGTIADNQVIDVNFTGAITNVGTCDNVVSATISDFDGNDVTPNYDITCIKGMLTVKQRPITIKSFDKIETYNGAPNCTGEKDFSIEEGLLVDKHDVKLTVSGSQTIVGSSENSYSVNIFDDENNDVTDNYLITSLFGTLTVTKRRIEITSNGFSRQYDGTELTEEGWSITIGEQAPEQTVKVFCVGKITDVGRVDNEFSYQILDNDGKDVSSNYIVEKVYGELVVLKRDLKIETASDTKIYDGDELSNSKDYKILEGYSLANGENINVLSSTKIRTYSDGVTENRYQIEILKGEKDVTSNYNISYVYGKLQIARATLIVKTESLLNQVYTGEQITYEHGRVEGIDATSDFYEFKVTGQLIDVGTVVNGYDLKIFDKYGNPSEDNYDIIQQLGKLQVVHRSLAIKTYSDSRTYNGEMLYNRGYDIIDGTSLAPNQNLLVADSTQIYRFDQGVVKNEFDVVIFDKFGEPATDNYLISYDTGTLSVLPAPLTIRTGTTENQVYTGKKITNPEYTLQGIVDANYTFEVVGYGIDVGEYDNDYVLKIYDMYGIDSISNYTVDARVGKINITPVEISVTTGTYRKPYDGKALYGNVDEVIITGSAVDGETISFAEPLVSRTEVGSTLNTIRLIAKSGEKETTSNYHITEYFGSLIVEKRNVFITSDSTLIMYNGKEQNYNKLTVHKGEEGDGLLEELGHRLDESSVVFGSGYENVGVHKNLFNYSGLRFVDESGNNVTKYYNVLHEFGNIQIYGKPLSIITRSAEKIYDKTPLTCHEYDLYGELVEGHVLYIEITGQRTSPGESQNTFIVLDIVDEGSGTPKSVLKNYDLDEKYGVLYVFGTNSPSDSQGGSGTGENGGFGENDGGNISGAGSGTPEETPVYEVTTSVSGRIYLRQTSYGDYVVANNDSQWLEGRVYSGGTINPLAFPYLALKENYPSNSTTIKKLMSDAPYVLPYYTDLSANTDLNDVVINASDIEYSVIDVSYLLGNYKNGALTGTAKQEELDYRRFVEENYTHLPQKTDEYMQNIIVARGLSKDDSNIIEKVANLVSTHVPYSYEYNYVGDVATYFFSSAKTAVCKHYATAATALFRALGIPARYTVGFAVDVSAGDSSIVCTPGHAWVEVYINGFGWIPVEVTGSSLGGGSNENNNKIFVKPDDILVQGDMNTTISYTKTELVGKDLTELCQKNGYTYEFKVQGEQSGLGSSQSTITYFKLLDADGNDITEQYNFDKQPGKLQVYEQQIIISTGSLEVYYDGNVHSLSIDDPNAYTIDYGKWGSLKDGHYFGEISFGAYRKDAGSTDNVFSEFSIVDASGNDVTDFYNITFIYGKITVNKRPIIVTASSKTEYFNNLNGQPLTCSDYTLTTTLDGNALVNGHKAQVVIKSSLDEEGIVPNRISSVTIFDEFGRNVTSNYNIKKVSGTLEVI